MTAFRLEPTALTETRSRAETHAAAGGGTDLLARAVTGDGLRDEELATLLLATDVDTEVLLDLARRRPTGGPHLETFSPLYLTNECDAECAMCGMRRFNPKLVRETADDLTIRAQLSLLHRRGLRGIALVTGEYHHGLRRDAMLARVARAIAAAIDLGFEHVLINIGSLEAEEYRWLLARTPRTGDGRTAARLTMCTFQETYDRALYRRFIGSNSSNPRADFVRRLENFDRAIDAGMSSVNPGVLLGLSRDVCFELLALLDHVRHLLARAAQVYVSLPRLRRATGTAHHVGVSDDLLFRFAAIVAFGIPEAKVVISTREAPAVQRRLLPAISVLTPGSPGVAPYTEKGARFEIEASQFEVLDQRPIEAVLGDAMADGITFAGYEPGIIS